MSHFNIIVNGCLYLFQKCTITDPQASYYGIWGFSKNLISEKAKNRLLIKFYYVDPPLTRYIIIYYIMFALQKFDLYQCRKDITNISNRNVYF